MNDNRSASDILDDLIKQFKKTVPLPADGSSASPPLQGVKFDDAVPVTGMDVEVGDGTYIPADKNTWRSWTGLRKLLGQDFHGPVYNFGSPEGSKPYAGFRTCSCSKCQEHVAVAFKYN